MTGLPNQPTEDESQNLTDEERHLNAVLGEFLEAEQIGHPVDRGALLKSHPDLAESLNAFFADYDGLKALARPLREPFAAANDTSTLPPPENHQQETKPSTPVLGATAGSGLCETVASDPRDPEVSDSPSKTVIRYFGDYVILSELGRGGMGVVYKARQMSLHRLVALKMLREGALAGEDDRRRFQSEANAVAALDHPGIVPVYEVGEHLGRRYFSMKYIPGASLAASLTDYDQQFDAVARLVVAVSAAVNHAHQRGTLHRDLKPANILIDENGHPLVTDFGLAKRVDLDCSLTQSGAIVGTPSYMAPEQSTGHRASITTAVDVYGLGAILYALLTRQAPFAGDSVIDTLDHVRTRPPEPPTRLNPRVPRDLEVICLKCLEKEPARRYQSAADLGNDLIRWLEGRPITARPVSVMTRGRMWCRRNPVLSTLSASLTLALVAGMAGVSWKWRDAEYQKQLLAMERNAAIESRDEARTINHFLTDELLGQASPEQNPRGMKITVEELLERSSNQIGVARFKPRVEAAVRDTIGRTYITLGEFKKAEPHLVTALEIRRRILGMDHPDTFSTTDSVADLRRIQNRPREAEELFRKNLADRIRVLGEDHIDTAESLTDFGIFLHQQGKLYESEAMLRRAYTILLKRKGAEDPLTLRAMTSLARINQFLGNYDEFRQQLERGLVLTVKAVGKDRPQTLDAMMTLASAYQRQGSFDRAGELFKEVVESRERVQGKTHPNVYGAKNDLMVVRREQGRLDQAEELAREVFNGFRSVHGADHPDTLFAENNLAILFHIKGRLHDAEGLFRETLKLRREKLPPDHPNLADTLSHLGELLVDDHRPREAKPLLEESVSIYRRALPADDLIAVRAEIRYGICLAELGLFEEAEARLIRGYAKLPPGSHNASINRDKLGARIAKLYESWGHPDKSKEWLARTTKSGAVNKRPEK